MEIVIDGVILLVGFIFLIQGASFLVEGATAIAHKYKIPEIAIGLTMVALGTSLPEIVVNTISSFRGESEVVFANIIGSNIFNIYMVIGVVGVLRPLFVQRLTAMREIPFSILATLLVFVLINDQIFFNQFDNQLSAWEGFVLLGVFIVFMVFAFSKRKELKEITPTEKTKISTHKTVLFIFLGLIGIAIGGHFVVDKAISFAEYFNVSRKMIALLILAPGSALPELTTSLVSAFKNRVDLAVGNIVGSCMFNLLLVLSLSSFLGELNYNHALNFDLYFFFFGIFLFFITLFTGKKLQITRIESLIFFLFFLAYIYFLFIRK